jgi:hypothetical protein
MVLKAVSRPCVRLVAARYAIDPVGARKDGGVYS